jgi:hypothetical protein
MMKKSTKLKRGRMFTPNCSENVALRASLRVVFRDHRSKIAIATARG